MGADTSKPAKKATTVAKPKKNEPNRPSARKGPTKPSPTANGRPDSWLGGNDPFRLNTPAPQPRQNAQKEQPAQRPAERPTQKQEAETFTSAKPKPAGRPERAPKSPSPVPPPYTEQKDDSTPPQNVTWGRDTIHERVNTADQGSRHWFTEDPWLGRPQQQPQQQQSERVQPPPRDPTNVEYLQSYRRPQIPELARNNFVPPVQDTDTRDRKIAAVLQSDDDDYIGANLQFYRNEIKFRPSGEYIEVIHKHWYGNYRLLEESQTYIQWLFPLPEKSAVNLFAQPLKTHEATYIYNDDETRARVLTSYMMMLNFFGMALVDQTTGEVKRSVIWRDRLYYLNRSRRNYCRLTRIIKSLGALGFRHLQAPLVMFLLHETLETKTLSSAPIEYVYYWLRSIDNEFDRKYVQEQFQTKLNQRSKLRQQVYQTGRYVPHFQTSTKQPPLGFHQKSVYT